MSDTKQNRTKNIIIALLVLALVVIGYLLTKSSASVDDLTAEKQEIIIELEQIKSELLAANSDNDSMSLHISAEANRLTAIIDSISKLKEVSEQDLAKMKSRASRLMREKKILVAQNDSLNKAYQALKIEKEEVEEVLEEEVVKNAELTDENRVLNKNVAVGSMLQLSKMEVAAYKVKGPGKEKETTSASSTNRIKACFTIAKNLIANSGERVVYMRVTTPDLKVIASSDNPNVFMFNGQQMMYSAKQNVIYENNIIESCLNLDKEADFVSGEYTIELFTEGYKLGEAKLTLK